MQASAGQASKGPANFNNNHIQCYDLGLGRFISKDPIGFAAGDANQYRYVGNGPANSTDPSGLFELPHGQDVLDWIDAKLWSLLDSGEKVNAKELRTRRIMAPRTPRIPTATDVGLPDLRAQWQIEQAMRDEAWRRRQLLSSSDGCEQLQMEAEAAQSRETTGRLVGSFYPGYGDFIDAYEVLFARDYFSGDRLTDTEHYYAVRASLLPVVSRQGVSQLARSRSFRIRGAARLRELGLEGINLANRSYNTGRKMLERANFVLDRITSSGRRVFVNSKTGAEVYFDSGRALAPRQKPHWHIRDSAGNPCSRSGRIVGSDEMAGHIPAGQQRSWGRVERNQSRKA